MAKRKTVKSSANKQLIIEAFAEMARHKNIDRDLLQGIIEDTLSQMVRKKYGLESNFDIIVNMDKGDIEIYLIRTVVEEVTDPNLEVSLEEANEGGDGYDVGDEALTELNLENLSENFGRRLVHMAAQTLSQRVREVEKFNVVAEYSQKIGEIIVGEVYQVRRNDVYVMHNKVELRMPRSEQIWRERYKKGETLKALLKEVRAEDGTASQPEIVISRSDPMFLHRLFEIEIPEIYDGIIEINGIAREPGERAKVAVSSHDERVDPAGACIGMKGVRVHSIVRELSNEHIDVVYFAPEAKKYIANALSPARVKDITIDEETRTATVLVAEDQVSLAIGKNGQNVRLAMKLTGYTIDLVKEGGEDIELAEFKEELGEELFNLLAASGISTAKEFLIADEDKLLTLDGLTAENLDELREVISSEFDEEELRNLYRDAKPGIRRPVFQSERAAIEEATAEAEAATDTPVAAEATDTPVATEPSDQSDQSDQSEPADQSDRPEPAELSDQPDASPQPEVASTTSETTGEEG
jgi:N utilization substance protein A